MITSNKYFAVTLIIFLRQSKLCMTDTVTTEAEEPTTESPVCSSSEPTCLDCLTLQICYPSNDGNLIPVQQTCKNENPKTPYCDKNSGTCVDNDASCVNEPATANCYGEGIIPDPLNCKQYFNCVNKDARSIYGGVIYTCPDGAYAYDHKLRTCRLFQKCLDFTEKNLCFNKANKIVVYPSDRSIYARCPPPNKNLKPIVNKCKGSYLYNPAINKCDAVCENTRKIRDNLSCNQYYECIKALVGYVRQLRVCPTGQDFIEDKQICEKSVTPCIPIGN